MCCCEKFSVMIFMSFGPPVCNLPPRILHQYISNIIHSTRTATDKQLQTRCIPWLLSTIAGWPAQFDCERQEYRIIFPPQNLKCVDGSIFCCLIIHHTFAPFFSTCFCRFLDLCWCLFNATFPLVLGDALLKQSILLSVDTRDDVMTSWRSVRGGHCLFFWDVFLPVIQFTLLNAPQCYCLWCISPVFFVLTIVNVGCCATVELWIIFL